MKLYEITKEMRALDELFLSCIDEETGEVKDDGVIDILEQELKIQLQTKGAGIIKSFKNSEAMLNGVVTAINFKGWRCWGSETAKNPLATDPKDKYIYGRRIFKYIGNELVISYFNNVDKKFTLKMAETMKKSMNIRLNALVAADQLLSAKVNFYAVDNSLIDIINGDITWTIDLGIIPGAKSITFKKVYDVDALQKFAESLTA